MRNVEKSHYCPAVCADLFISSPLFLVIIVFSLVVRFFVSILVERVFEAFVEDCFHIFRSIGTFLTWNGVREPEFVQKGWEVVRIIFNIKLLIKKVLNLLFPPRLCFKEGIEQFLLLSLIEVIGGLSPRSSASFSQARLHSTDGPNYSLFLLRRRHRRLLQRVLHRHTGVLEILILVYVLIVSFAH